MHKITLPLIAAAMLISGTAMAETNRDRIMKRHPDVDLDSALPEADLTQCIADHYAGDSMYRVSEIAVGKPMGHEITATWLGATYFFVRVTPTDTGSHVTIYPGLTIRNFKKVNEYARECAARTPG